MWSMLVIMLILPLSAPAWVAAQQLYACKTPEGRLTMQDTPCPAGSAERPIEQTEAKPPQPRGVLQPPPSSAQKSRSFRSKKVLASTEFEPQVPLKECVNMNDVGTKVVRHGRRRSDFQWKVDVSNRCPQPVRVTVMFGVYDRDDFAIQSQQKRLHVPARGSTIVQGTLLLSPANIQRLASKKAEISLP